MSGADPTKQLYSNQSTLVKLIANDQSILMHKGYTTTALYATDYLSKTTPIGQQANFGGQDHFQVLKRGGRIFEAYLRVTISAATLAAGHEAAYVDDLGTLICENVETNYSSKPFQAYRGDFLKAYNRLMYHDVAREGYIAQTLSGMAPGGADEVTREANLTNGITLLVPLSWLWFTRELDYAFTPEAISGNMDVFVDYRRFQQLIYARVTATGLTPVGDAWLTVQPQITKCELVLPIIHDTKVHKALHLSTFEQRQGNVFKLLDVEQQLRKVVPAAANAALSIKLENFRLDSQFLVFYMRDSLINTDYAIDRGQSDTTATGLTGGGSVAALQQILSFRVLANGGTLVDRCTDLENRAIWRPRHFPGSQIGEYYYIIPWSLFCRENRNVSSFQNMVSSFPS